MGEDDNDFYVIRGVLLDHPTPFTLAEMVPAVTSSEDGTTTHSASLLADNLLFRGGDKGGDGVLLLHDCGTIEGAEPIVHRQDQFCGVYQGGWEGALQDLSPERCKAFFNYCEFTERELEKLLDQQDESDEDGEDGWVSLQVDKSVVLNGDYGRGDCWRLLRNAIVQFEAQQKKD